MYCERCFKEIKKDQVGFKGKTLNLSTTIDHMVAYYICKDCDTTKRLIGGRWHIKSK